VSIDLQFIATQLSQMLERLARVEAVQVGIARDIGEIKNDLRYINANRLEELEKKR
jgi:hypothetical protein